MFKLSWDYERPEQDPGDLLLPVYSPQVYVRDDDTITAVAKRTVSSEGITSRASTKLSGQWPGSLRNGLNLKYIIRPDSQKGSGDGEEQPQLEVDGSDSD